MRLWRGGGGVEGGRKEVGGARREHGTSDHRSLSPYALLVTAVEKAVELHLARCISRFRFQFERVSYPPLECSLVSVPGKCEDLGGDFDHQGSAKGPAERAKACDACDRDLVCELEHGFAVGKRKVRTTMI